MLHLEETASGSLRVSLGLSYARLAGQEQLLFRLLAPLPSTGFSEWAASGLLPSGPKEYSSEVRTLDRRGMIEAVAGEGRSYRLPDVLRSYARTLLENDPPELASEAYSRLASTLWRAGANALRTLLNRDVRDLNGTTPPQPDAAAVSWIGPDPLRWLIQERDTMLCVAERLADGNDTRNSVRLAIVLALGSDLAPLEVTTRPGFEAVLLRGLDALVTEAATRDTAGELWLALGRLRYQVSDWDGAGQALGHALEEFHHAGNILAEAHARAGLGDVLREEASWNEAVQQLEHAIKLFESAGETIPVWDAQLTLGRIFRYRGRWTDAERLFKPAIDDASVSRQHLNRVRALALHDLADLLREQGHLSTALELLDDAERLFIARRDELRAARVVSSHVDVYRDLGRWPQMDVARCMTVFERDGDLRWSGRTRLNFAIGLRYQGALDDAEREVGSARDTLSQLGDRKGTAMCDQTLGLIAIARTRYAQRQAWTPGVRRALDLLGPALERFRELEDRVWIAN